MQRYTTYSEEETRAIAKEMGSGLAANSVVCLFGDLGAGKTTFIKGLIEGAARVSSEEVCSPTFVYLNIYQGEMPVFHFDLYRLAGEDEFLGMGFDEFFTAGGVCCMEWADRIQALLPLDAIKVTLEHRQEGIRSILVDNRDSP